MLNKDTTSLLTRLDEALLRMIKRGHQDTASYCRLLQKRNAVAAGADYTITDVTEQLISGVGGKLANVSKATCGGLRPNKSARRFGNGHVRV